MIPMVDGFGFLPDGSLALQDRAATMLAPAWESTTPFLDGFQPSGEGAFYSSPEWPRKLHTCVGGGPCECGGSCGAKGRGPGRRAGGDGAFGWLPDGGMESPPGGAGMQRPSTGTGGGAQGPGGGCDWQWGDWPFETECTLVFQERPYRVIAYHCVLGIDQFCEQHFTAFPCPRFFNNRRLVVQVTLVEFDKVAPPAVECSENICTATSHVTGRCRKLCTYCDFGGGGGGGGGSDILHCPCSESHKEPGQAHCFIRYHGSEVGGKPSGPMIIDMSTWVACLSYLNQAGCSVGDCPEPSTRPDCGELTGSVETPQNITLDSFGNAKCGEIEDFARDFYNCSVEVGFVFDCDVKCCYAIKAY